MNAPAYKNKDLPIDIRVHDLMDRMTLEEKVNQLTCHIFGAGEGSAEEKQIINGIGGIALLGSKRTIREMSKFIYETQEYVINNSPSGIPALFHCEALSGLMLNEATQYPTSVGLGATFAPEYVEKMADTIRKQMYAAGVREALSPVFDVARDLRWGRTNETYGADPTLVSSMGCAFVNGLQGKDITEGIAATAKHFLAYSNSECGMSGKALTDEQELREVYAKPFEAAITVADIKCFMNAYSEINGEPVCASEKILTDLLRDTMGFNGLMVSDYASIIRLVQCFHTADNVQEAAIKCLKAGLDIEAPSPLGYGTALIEAIQNKLIDIKYIDRSVERILKLKFELGLFENPYPSSEKVEQEFYGNNNRELVVEITRKIMTLTKNDGILPIKNKALKIAVIGPSGNTVRNNFGTYSTPGYQEMFISNLFKMQGVEALENVKKKYNDMTGIELDNVEGLSSDKKNKPESSDTIDRWIRHYMPEAKSIYEALQEKFESVTYTQGCHIKNDTPFDIAGAVEAAKSADLVVMALGGRNGWGLHCTSGEGINSANLTLSGHQEELLQAVYEANSNIVLIHINSKPLVSPFAYENIPSIIEAWLPGAYGGAVITEVLTGECNPGGRLNFDIPRQTGTTPIYHYQRNGTGLGSLSPIIANPDGYIDCSAIPQRPFGYGLSYTDFEYSDFIFEPSKEDDSIIHISVTVKNIGEQTGDEVVQLYGKDITASMIRPRQELVGFKRVTLKAGESKQIKFTFSMSQMAFLNSEKKWITEEGDFEFFIGKHSAEKVFTHTFTFPKTIEIDRAKRSFFANASVCKAEC